MVNKLKNVTLCISVVLLPFIGNAQCAMCRAVLENGDDTAVAEGVNNGIMFLMAMPYILVAFLAFIIYKKFRN